MACRVNCRLECVSVGAYEQSMLAQCQYGFQFVVGVVWECFVQDQMNYEANPPECLFSKGKSTSVGTSGSL